MEEQPKLRTGVTNTLGSVTPSLNISGLIGNKAGEEEEKCQKRMHFQSGICQNQQNQGLLEPVSPSSVPITELSDQISFFMEKPFVVPSLQDLPQ